MWTNIKKKYNISDSLIIFKIDIKDKEELTTYVKYEIYNPYTLELLNLSCCDQSKIILNIPVNLDSRTISLYDNMNQYGYNLFNPNDSFYNDICSTYKSENGTDISLSDRQNNYYKENWNKSLCQDECVIEGYNISDKTAICECSAQYPVAEPDLNYAKTSFDFKNLLNINNLFINADNSNFLVLKCYKLVFNLNNVIKNIGMIIMTVILIVVIILIIIFCTKERKKLDFFINTILKKYFFNQNLEKGKEKKKKEKEKEKKKKEKEKKKKEKKKKKKEKKKKKILEILKKKSKNQQ